MHIAMLFLASGQTGTAGQTVSVTEGNILSAKVFRLATEKRSAVVSASGEVYEFSKLGRASVIAFTSQYVGKKTDAIAYGSRAYLADARGPRNYEGPKQFKTLSASIVKDGVEFDLETVTTPKANLIRRISMNSAGDLMISNRLKYRGLQAEISIVEATNVTSSKFVRLDLSRDSRPNPLGYVSLWGTKLKAGTFDYVPGTLALAPGRTGPVSVGAQSNSGLVTVDTAEGEIAISSARIARTRYPMDGVSSAVILPKEAGNHVEVLQFSPLYKMGGNQIVIQEVTLRIR